MKAELRGGEIYVSVDALDSRDQFLDGLESTVTLEGPIGAKEVDRIRRTAPLVQRGPGYYTAKLPIDRVGTFALSAEHFRDGSLVGRGQTQIARPYPAEYASFGDATGSLAEAAEASGGSKIERAADLFAPRGEHVLHREALWPTIVLIAIAWLLVDLLARRARLS